MKIRLLAAAGVVIGALCVLIAVLPALRADDTQVQVPLPVVLEPISSPPSSLAEVPTPSPTVTTPTKVKWQAAPTAVSIKQIGMNARVLSLKPGTDGLTPPTVGDVYYWKGRGLAGTVATDTLYLLGHTVRAGGGVFDRVQELHKNDIIVVTARGTQLRYVIDSTQSFSKDAIADSDKVYANVPGRIVLVSCYLRQDGQPQTDNFVVFGHLAD